MNDKTLPAPNANADGIHPPAPDTVSMIKQAADQASALAQRGLDAVRDQTHELRGRARRASEGTVDYIQAEPVKAMLIAAAAGAALMALVGLIARANHRD